MDQLASYFGFQGRARRSEYWLTQLAAIGVLIVYGMLSALLGVAKQMNESDATTGGIVGLLVLLLTLAFLVFWVWIYLAVAVRRCHDRGHSGMFLFWALLPLFGGIILLIDLGFGDSIPGRNAYGMSDKYPQSVAHTFA